MAVDTGWAALRTDTHTRQHARGVTTEVQRMRTSVEQEAGAFIGAPTATRRLRVEQRHRQPRPLQEASGHETGQAGAHHRDVAAHDDRAVFVAVAASVIVVTIAHARSTSERVRT